MSKRQGCKKPLSTVLVLKVYTKDHHELLVVAKDLACNTKDREAYSCSWSTRWIATHTEITRLSQACHILVTSL